MYISIPKSGGEALSWWDIAVFHGIFALCVHRAHGWKAKFSKFLHALPYSETASYMCYINHDRGPWLEVVKSLPDTLIKYFAAHEHTESFPPYLEQSHFFAALI